MNLGQAVAVCLYELVRHGKVPRLPEKLPPAPAAKVERITEMLLEALHESGYLGRRHVADAEPRIRRLVRRLNLPARDTVIWLGILAPSSSGGCAQATLRKPSRKPRPPLPPSPSPVFPNPIAF